jgi:hypothetical protein
MKSVSLPTPYRERKRRRAAYGVDGDTDGARVRVRDLAEEALLEVEEDGRLVEVVEVDHVVAAVGAERIVLQQNGRFLREGGLSV